MVYLFIGFYVFAGISYLDCLLGMESVSLELNGLAQRLDTGHKPIGTPLQGSKLLCLVAILFWPILSLIGFAGKILHT